MAERLASAPPHDGRVILVTENADAETLVSVVGDTSPWFPAGFVAELEELLGRRVQVVTEDGLYRVLRRRILKEAIPL